MIRPSGLCEVKIKITRLVSHQVVQVENFKDSPNHSHSLNESDRLKRPEVIKTLVKQEAAKTYPPAAIVHAVKEMAASELKSSVQHLNRKEVANIKYQIHGPMEAHLKGDSQLKSDILEVISYLQGQEYYVE